MAKPMQAQAAQSKWRDLRDWLTQVEALGELKRVTGANSEEDIGAITEMLDHSEESPCVLFDDIPSFQRGYRVLANSMGSRKRQAVTLGIDPADAAHERLLDFWRGMLKGFTPIPPTTVKRGAVQENVLRDAEVDLTRGIIGGRANLWGFFRQAGEQRRDRIGVSGPHRLTVEQP